MADDGFRLPGSSYGELVKIIRGYYAQKDAAAPSDVGQTIGMHQSNVSRNNAFLVSVGIIEGGNKKTMTSPGRALGRALDYEMLEEISKEWRSIVLANEFLEKLVTAVRVRRGMEYSVFQTHIAYSAGQQKNANVMAGASAVIEILKASGLLRDEDGKLVAATPSENVEHIDLSTGASIQVPVSIAKTAQSAELGSLPQITIQIQVQCSAAELAELGPKLRDLLAEIRNQSIEEA